MDNVSVTVPRGKIVGIVGESGCGKSMTAMSILRLIRGRSRAARSYFAEKIF